MTEKSIDNVFESEEGRVVTREQLLRYVRYEASEFEKAENGYVVGGVGYTGGSSKIG